MTRNKKIIAVAASVAALGAGGAAIASATGAGPLGEENEKPINGPALEQASAAALAHTGPGLGLGHRGRRRGELLRGRGHPRRR